MTTLFTTEAFINIQGTPQYVFCDELNVNGVKLRMKCEAAGRASGGFIGHELLKYLYFHFIYFLIKAMRS